MYAPRVSSSRALRGAASHDGERLGVHLLDDRVCGIGVEIAQAHVAAAHHLVGNRRAQESDCGSDTGLRGHDDGVHPELVREAAGVQRRRTTESDHRVLGRDLALLDRVHSCRVRHRLVDHLRDPERGHSVPSSPIGAATSLAIALMGGLHVEGDLSARKPPWIDSPEHDVGVGDGGRRRLHASVGGGSGVGTGAVGSHRDAPHGVDPGDGAAARPDLHHLDDRNAQRNSAALAEAGFAVDLELACGLRRVVADEAYLGGGAAHVEGDDLVEPHFRRDPGRENRAAGRTGLDEPDGEPDRGIEARKPTARGHEQHRACETERREPGTKACEVARHERLHVGVRNGSAETLVLPDLGTCFARHGDGNAGQRGGDDFARSALVGGVGVAVEKSDPDAFDREPRKLAGYRTRPPPRPGASAPGR